MNYTRRGGKVKEIKAYIQPFMLQKITDALHEINIRGMSICDIKGFGEEKDESYPHHSRDYVFEFGPKIKIEIVCLDDEVDKIIEVIKTKAHTGRKGDGKIFVTNVEKTVSIRTGETGDKII